MSGCTFIDCYTAWDSDSPTPYSGVKDQICYVFGWGYTQDKYLDIYNCGFRRSETTVPGDAVFSGGAAFGYSIYNSYSVNYNSIKSYTHYYRELRSRTYNSLHDNPALACIDDDETGPADYAKDIEYYSAFMGAIQSGVAFDNALFPTIISYPNAYPMVLEQ